MKRIRQQQSARMPLRLAMARNVLLTVRKNKQGTIWVVAVAPARPFFVLNPGCRTESTGTMQVVLVVPAPRVRPSAGPRTGSAQRRAGTQSLGGIPGFPLSRERRPRERVQGRRTEPRHRHDLPSLFRQATAGEYLRGAGRGGCRPGRLQDARARRISSASMVSVTGLRRTLPIASSVGRS
jgi:hypothetical protein